MQRALMQFFKPANYFTVREALIQAGRADLIGSGCDCLIPAQPPKDAIEARRARANQVGDHYRSVANLAKGEPAAERGAKTPRSRWATDPAACRPGGGKRGSGSRQPEEEHGEAIEAA